MVISIDRLFFHLLQFEVNWTFYLRPPVPRSASINCSPVRFVFFFPLSQFHFHFFPFLLVLLSLHFLSFFFLTFYLLPPVPRPASINCSPVRFVFFFPFSLFHFLTCLLFYFHFTFLSFFFLTFLALTCFAFTFSLSFFFTFTWLLC